MNRNLSLIVVPIGSNYNILIPTVPPDARLYTTTQPYRGADTFLCEVTGNELVLPDPAPGKRSYFVLRWEGGETLAASRLVEIPAVENFRDQGGYRTMDGKTVKWGRFFRGGAFHPLEDDAKAYLDSMGLRSIFDYRSKEEQSQHPDYIPVGARHFDQPAHLITSRNNSGDGNVLNLQDRIAQVHTQEEADAVFDHFGSLYDHLPFANAAYEAMLESLDDPDCSLYQHCQAGKDRTGVGCAILLLALGVDRDTVMGDYLLSAVYREAVNRRYVERYKPQNDVIRGLMARVFSVERALLQRSFEAMDQKYSDIAGFLQGEYGIAPERMARWREYHTL